MGRNPSSYTDKNLILQRGIYYFRKTIPKAYRGILGRKYWSKSLGTSELKIARDRAKGVMGEYEAAISLCFSKESWLKSSLVTDFERSSLFDQDDAQALSTLKTVLGGRSVEYGNGLTGSDGQNGHHKTHHNQKHQYPTIQEMLDEFEKLTSDKRVGLSTREAHFKLRPRRAAIEMLADALGDVRMDQIHRRDALKIREILVGQVNQKKITAHTANKKLGHLRHIFNKVNDIHQYELKNPFSSLGLEETTKRTPPFEIEWIKEHFLKGDSLSGLSQPGRDCIQAMIETGANPKELAFLDPEEDIILNHDFPHIWIRPNRFRRGLKSDHRERKIPLVGVALEVFRKSKDPFAAYRRPAGAEALSAMCMKYCRSNGLFPTKQHRLYSFRHTFKNRMREAGLQQELQDYLMGHKNQGMGSQYGTGYSLQYIASVSQGLCLCGR